jgi:hypothetical protein
MMVVVVMSTSFLAFAAIIIRRFLVTQFALSAGVLVGIRSSASSGTVRLPSISFITIVILT